VAQGVGPEFKPQHCKEGGREGERKEGRKERRKEGRKERNLWYTNFNSDTSGNSYLKLEREEHS
jgi:hypothetical protein